ncbi:single-stranded DNA-binding protein [uncultured Microbacterium sp.]|uniref:Single-stranded DNA-binding protein n=1 Tax=uncultured Microbacterium sp. TaxID=191216 RepID=A0A1Y5P059_9MICO|nr:single-stranded DNA-binding protein [uncultured Microbacterium sp.]SBS70729.1 Single-stranded DNA-binding protein [uncultured Microbacterium sp.]
MNDRITVVGNIASVPERRQTGTGVPVAKFRLATSQRHRDAQGVWVDGDTNFYSVSAYRQLAEHALASLQRGQRVIVTGGFKLRTWEVGEKRGTEAEIDADALGPDLQWGTSVFTSLKREVAAPAVPASWAAGGDTAGGDTAGGDGAGETDGDETAAADDVADDDVEAAREPAWARGPLREATPF